MIITVTLNVALDRTVAVPRIRLGRRHRAVEARRAPGGKGVNVARALKHLGEPVIATGLAGGATGARIRELLTGEQVLHDFTEVAGDSRTNISIVDPTSGEQTEINERGPEVSAEEVERFADRLAYLAGGASFCVIAGSLPPGVPADVYAQVITTMSGLGVPVLLDTDGEPMRAGLRAQPAAVAPERRRGRGGRRLRVRRARGPDDGPQGAGRDGRRGRLRDDRRGLRRGGRQGAGPAPLRGDDRAARAGLQRRLRRCLPRRPRRRAAGPGRSAVDSLAFAVACGAQSTQHLGAGSLDAGEVARIADRVAVRELDAPVGVA